MTQKVQAHHRLVPRAVHLQQWAGPEFRGSPGDLVSLGMMQRTKWGCVERKLVISLFRFSCGPKIERRK